jgi:glycosyltransferase involved in cell wall biosynthesis
VANPPKIGFIGLYSYLPNLDGVRWFLLKCWPAIRLAVPGIRFRMIGKDTDGPLRPTAPNVDALGWVADPAAEIASWSAMVIPIRLGAGTRIKIADAFSRKCPVVSTSLGAFGYEVNDKQHLRIADDPAAFARACVELVRDRAGAAAMAERAWADFVVKWTWEAIAPRVWAAAEDCLRRGRASPR